MGSEMCIRDRASSGYGRQQQQQQQQQQQPSYLQQEQQRVQPTSSWDPLMGSSSSQQQTGGASAFGQSPPQTQTSRGLGAFGDYGGAFGGGAFGGGGIGSIGGPSGGLGTTSSVGAQTQTQLSPASPRTQQQQQTDGQFLENLDNLFDLIGD